MVKTWAYTSPKHWPDKPACAGSSPARATIFDIDNKFNLLYNTILRSSKMQKRKTKVPRERNQFVAAALFRKAGSHRKPHKALRKQENQQPVY